MKLRALAPVKYPDGRLRAGAGEYFDGDPEEKSLQEQGGRWIAAAEQFGYDEDAEDRELRPKLVRRKPRKLEPLPGEGEDIEE